MNYIKGIVIATSFIFIAPIFPAQQVENPQKKSGKRKAEDPCDSSTDTPLSSLLKKRKLDDISLIDVAAEVPQALEMLRTAQTCPTDTTNPQKKASDYVRRLSFSAVQSFSLANKLKDLDGASVAVVNKPTTYTSSGLQEIYYPITAQDGSQEYTGNVVKTLYVNQNFLLSHKLGFQKFALCHELSHLSHPEQFCADHFDHNVDQESKIRQSQQEEHLADIQGIKGVNCSVCAREAVEGAAKMANLENPFLQNSMNISAHDILKMVMVTKPFSAAAKESHPCWLERFYRLLLASKSIRGLCSLHSQQIPLMQPASGSSCSSSNHQVTNQANAPTA